MGTFYPDDQRQITLYASEKYPSEKDELRAMTLAGLRIIQNSRQLDNRSMRVDVFKFLLSTKALSYWKQKGWLTPRGRTNIVRLTESGLANCSASLHDDAATNTQEALIMQWERRMIFGDGIADQERVFELPLSLTT